MGCRAAEGTRELFGCRKGLERAVAGHLARAKPVKSPRHDFSTFLATVNLAAAEVVIDSSVVLLRDTVRCHSRLGVLGGLNLYPPVLM